MSKHLLLEQKGRILLATFNRPKDNKVSDGMARELGAAVAIAHECSDMVLLRSIGPDFCTGRLRDPDAGPPHPEAYSRRPEYDSIFYCYRAIRDAQVPGKLYNGAKHCLSLFNPGTLCRCLAARFPTPFRVCLCCGGDIFEFLHIVHEAKTP